MLTTVASRMVSVFLMFSSGEHFFEEDEAMFDDQLIDLTRLSGRLVSVRYISLFLFLIESICLSDDVLKSCCIVWTNLVILCAGMR